MAGNISHDNVLSIYDFGEDDQHHPFMVMEFLKGEDLRHAIKGGRTGGLREKLKIAVQVARALEYIQSRKSSTATSSRKTSTSARPGW